MMNPLTHAVELWDFLLQIIWFQEIALVRAYLIIITFTYQQITLKKIITKMLAAHDLMNENSLAQKKKKHTHT